MTEPIASHISLGVGIQSSALLLLAIQNRIPAFGAAIFSDMRWDLHRQRVPLGEAMLRPHAGERQEMPGCGPWICPHPVEPAPEDTPDPATAGFGTRSGCGRWRD